MPDSQSNQNLREEFNRWASAGRGEEMEHGHWPITKPALEFMQIAPDENILDAGCGGGWLSRFLSKVVAEGRVVGMDISDEMARRARRESADFSNLVFIVGSVDEIPWEESFFHRVISVESAYYWPDPAKGIREIHRVLRDGGSAWILINYYHDNPHCHQWGNVLNVTTHLLKAEEWAAMFREVGFVDVSHCRIPDRTPPPEAYEGRWFRDAQQLADFRREGALLIHGAK